MSGKRALLMKTPLKIQSAISIRENLGGFIAIVGQSWLLPAVIHLLLSPLLVQVFPRATAAATQAS